MAENPDIAIYTLVAGFLGGLGLFLLGMTLMTEGLKLAGGKALQHILGTWTRTRARALGSGMAVTALVQSSSAVTVATIGFANAGLLTLGQAVWVIFGSNVGTTMTGWLVALVGLDIRIEAFSLPAIGVGALLYLFARGSRGKNLGLALAGFGLLFFGIEVLRNAFMGLSATVDLGALAKPGVTGLVIMVALGALLTVLMQSSSASMAMALTAAMSGALPLEAAAAGVIGANLGTTIKAMLVVIGATANARRVAAAHVLFNTLTALVALIILPWFLGAIAWIWGATGEAPAPAMLLALFHTGFNLLGVALMIPLAPIMIRWLQKRFRTPEEDAARPRYLDRSSAGVPDLALGALILEIDRLGDMGHRMAREALAEHPPAETSLAMQKSAVERLVETIGEFSARISTGHLPETISEGITEAMRVARYHRDVATLAYDIGCLRRLRERHALPAIAAQRRQWQELAVRALDLARLEPGDPQRDDAAEAVAQVEQEYARLKQALLREGTSGSIPIPEMERQLRIISMARRLVTQSDKARRYEDHLHSQVGQSKPDREAPPEQAG
ncbi:Na/Pi-cotransporter II-like protein [Thioalkalivibrio denitrificans]|uniref:Na/Pi-cotransporter II-like protein n=1 Tax=Thioalkalivibrio denitrificans TaxID=108003 RepID=A0A1V3ND71_9GAMM|nr:Na/Pi cotransporter family protein [Thioalkalivibrio denitrificans]OOG22736.1 Na/Pi-cotransporter II-like protein [Thioalkalivibrio denitrificans]